MDPNAARSRALKRLMKPLQLTRMGMITERAVRSFWPVWTLVFAALAALAFGAHDMLPPEGVWSVGGLWIVAVIVAIGLGIRAYTRPTGKEVVARLDATLPGRPIKALSDKQAIGAGDFGSEAVWNAHVERMAERIESARAVQPDLRLSDRDPYALRYVALGALVTALLFGSLWRITSLDDAAGAGPGAALAAGPSWEGWIEPPAYTGKPSLYLNDIEQAEFTVPEGSEVTIRLYGEVGALDVRETVSGMAPAAPAEEASADEAIPEATPAADDGVRSFAINGSGEIEIGGSGGRQWTVLISPDTAPRVELVGEVDKSAMGELQQRFRAEDDYGVIAGSARITLDEGALDRRYGLVAEPEPREPVVLDLPMTISGNRASFEETLIDDLSKHAWANLPVVMQMSVEDANGQQGRSEARAMVLPGRRFFDPAASALIELRRDLLWSRENAARTAQILRTITWKPASAIAQPRTYLQVRMVLKRLEAAGETLPEATRDELAEALWEIAVRIEEGTLSNALERLRQAQERLNEAIRNGASDEEIAQLMEEMRQAMQDYMRQLAQQQQQNPGEQQPGQQGETMELSQQDLQDMLDKLEELMQQGRTAEAQELLNQLMEMMQNMQVTQGQGGQGQQSPGEEAMEGLAETLRDQQGLSDEAFRDLQEQFNPNAQQGESGQNEGRNGNQGQGESHEQGQNQQGQGDNPDGRPGEGGEPDERSLAQRQRELRRELERQRGQLPGAGTEQGDAARRSLDEAGRAMDRAEESLRQGDMAEAIDNQSQAIERLREGMRNLGEAMAEERRQQQGGQGENVGRADPNNRRDPLGRDRGSTGPLGTEEHMLQGDDVYRRARDLLDEIRRRSSEQGRPDVELEYLKRLLERF
ncbi:TIGR02302 family protein [Oceanicola sp. D3]|uniref:TIGR02302 family protein n=1 Tax=Oceanicola sp. D3 TaxID=2587163 RepID=UPI001123E336|nr:TIGR02302 family protein [Oceanicola sp. D3]QDC11017.1 TIGR02302 family protein [Oceanicola sp. D3]